MNRGRRGEKVFSDKKDYEEFLTVLKDSSEMFGVRIAAYCLMPNHYHLLLQTPYGNLSRVMRHVNGVYTQRYNRQRNIDGQLFRGRYRSILIEVDSHLLELLRYIHRNPVRARICESADEYPWSSHRGYVSGAKKWDWIDRGHLLEMFAPNKGNARKAYAAFVMQEDSQGVTEFFSRKNVPSIFGSRDFAHQVRDKWYQRKKHAEVPASRQLVHSITEIITAVCENYGVDERDLQQTRRGRANEPRSVAVYLARKRSGFRLQEIGREFGITSYSSVSSIVVRTEKLLHQDKNLRKRLETIVMKLKKSHAKI